MKLNKIDESNFKNRNLVMKEAGLPKTAHGIASQAWLSLECASQHSDFSVFINP
jgi:hypothetical protein